ncbi:MAG: hypothetical protein KAT46_02170 [Deltaproteobacteria bacterium]|nr:hypothetical protein [Deltaproteobacteria bacterium]
MVNDGKDFERLVQLIEKSISPDSTVEHNVQLPILNSKINATTQCDLVIRSGVYPRETMTIIEVQDREYKVTPNDFRGWQQKLDQVGAQHLICVSRQDFPVSIKEQASMSGNRIYLITLKEIGEEKIPMNFTSFIFNYRYFDINALMNLKVGASKREAEKLGMSDFVTGKTVVNTKEKIWSKDKKNLITLHLLCMDSIPSPTENTLLGDGKLHFKIDKDPPLYTFLNGKYLRVGLDCDFEYKNEIIEKPVSILQYEQDENGAVAWVAEVFHETLQGLLSVKVPIIKSGNDYVVRSIQAILPLDHEMSISCISKN